MPTKSKLPCFLAALVLTAYTHCVFSHGMEAGDRHHQLRSDDQPLDDSRALCENESSCICKGATLAVGTEAPAPELSFVDTICVVSASLSLRPATDSLERQIAPDQAEALISGGTLRAQLQRFLL
ncbi:MAG: hypothetical protein H6821_02930 [Planctomycetaceae bacterium]|nr:hypothetical protein [Planctomycetales bacterium]MCB9873109.1 hypothetical protein [Planctomycetaceae bacterium]MCB9937789.1 hypothetical protein [Planctomycetaceae bacterium]